MRLCWNQHFARWTTFHVRFIFVTALFKLQIFAPLVWAILSQLVKIYDHIIYQQQQQPQPQQQNKKNGTKKKRKTIGMCLAANNFIGSIETLLCMLYHFIEKKKLFSIQFNISIDLVEYIVLNIAALLKNTRQYACYVLWELEKKKVSHIEKRLYGASAFYTIQNGLFFLHLHTVNKK